MSRTGGIALSLWLVACVLGLAWAADFDHRGWSPGQPAKGTARIVGHPPEVAKTVSLPGVVSDRIRKKVPALIVYFSPGCPHCRHVADELRALGERHEGSLDVIGVATSSTSAEALAEFTETFRWTFPVVIDSTREVASALGARSTPSAMLVQGRGKRQDVLDAWYPYGPGFDALVEMRLAKSPWDVFTPGEYKGGRQCAACHLEETESWLLSHHSVAWRTLVRGGHHTNPECTDCHVTGAGQPSGWTPTSDGRLVDVGCESCHGPGGPHDGERTEPASTCVGCHDKKHSIAFRYEKGLPLIDHFKASGMSEDAFRRARADLIEGDAPRALLAFDQGTYVGSEACAGCHAGEVAWWRSSPHGQAMQTLHGAGATDDKRCVRCHATPKEVGFAGDEPEAYRRTEGIGCESCHGPGGAHVAAGGGSDNIEGLGESCPVCVIEAVCTTCHTSAWDPTWNLETDLPRVHHGVPDPTEGGNL